MIKLWGNASISILDCVSYSYLYSHGYYSTGIGNANTGLLSFVFILI
jgi:hypothetical protein